ncbi:hypothetical protein L226DRAFT_438021, partial [Lentinus tigrinus ALCF2SS1-7]|uniref:uncharacterized protein n=1 Tax=Lentinus tigrinus ALCF2SS1-7 TaxID=1328758 RepID=UPI001165E790
FIDNADRRFGPITTVRKNGKIEKKIPWTAFRLNKSDWDRVKLCADLLEDATRYIQSFYEKGVPCLHRAIPSLEALLTRWEKRRADPKFALFHPALDRGLDKLRKYYLKLDNTDAYILAQFCQPYYKLDYIEQKWGGEAEQQAEIRAGNPDAKNWTAEARKVVENAVIQKNPGVTRGVPYSASPSDDSARHTSPSGPAEHNNDDDDDDFDRARRRRLATADDDLGWQDEL